MKEDVQAIRTSLSIKAGERVPIGIGFLGWILDITEISDSPRLPAYLDELPEAIWFAFGVDLGKYVDAVRRHESGRDHKTTIFVMVNSVQEAVVAANEWKVDVIVVQGARRQYRLSNNLSTPHCSYWQV